MNQQILSSGYVIKILMVLVMFTGLSHACLGQTPSPTQFEDLFRLQRSITVTGTAQHRLASVINPLLTEQNIYISDFQAQRMYVADHSGRILYNIDGDRAPQSLGLRVPFGGTVDAFGKIYLNDRGGQLFILNAQGDNVASVVHPSNPDEVHVWHDTSGQGFIYLIGLASCDAPIACTIRRFHMQGNEIGEEAVYGDVGHSLPSLASWRAGIHQSTGHLFVVNVTSNNVEVYDRDMNLTNTVEVQVPSRVALRGRAGSSSDADYRPYAYDGPRLTQIAVVEDVLLVQWTVSAMNASTYRHMVSAYNLRGNVLVSGVPTDLLMVPSSGDTVIFKSDDFSGYGKVDVYEYRFIRPR